MIAQRFPSHTCLGGKELEKMLSPQVAEPGRKEAEGTKAWEEGKGNLRLTCHRTSQFESLALRGDVMRKKCKWKDH